MKRPSRLPPPPPPPPKPFRQSSNSLAQTTRTSFECYSRAESEYSEGLLSVQSVPYAPIQRSYSPSVGGSNYNSARSESGVYLSNSTSSKCSSGCCIRRYCPAAPSPCYPASCCAYSCRSQQLNESPQPVPRERTFRPKRSTSPMPMNKTDINDRPKPRYKCESLDYRRHIEQHIGRIFKYLKDRQERRNVCESSAEHHLPNHLEGIKKLLASKETRHLRSLRTRLGPKDFEQIKELGAGYIGKVWLVKNKFSSNLYAMKKLRKSQVFQQNHMARVIAERDILAEANNDWIVELYHSFQDEKYLYFILEYIPGGDMMNLLCKQNVFPEEWAQFYIAEISLALQFVHDMKFIHRDLKPDNILIDRLGHIKLTDFGLCRGNRWTHDLSYYRDDTFNSQGDNNSGHDEHPTITKALTRRELEHSMRKRALSVVGSPNYIAPEVLRQTDQTSNEELCDWWSVGVILYEMVVGYCPFINHRKFREIIGYNPGAEPPEEIKERIMNWRANLAFPSKTDPMSPPQMPHADGKIIFVSNEARSLIQGWLCEPEERLCQRGISDIQDHSFFKNIDWKRIRSMNAPYVPVLSHDLDTSHFDIFPPSNGQDATIGPSPDDGRRMNDFTYRNFWDNPK